MRKILIVATTLTGVALSGYFLFPAFWGNGHTLPSVSARDVAEDRHFAITTLEQDAHLSSVANDTPHSPPSAVAGIGTEAWLPWNGSIQSQNWLDTWRENWFRADATQRVDLVEMIEAHVDRLVTEGDPFSEAQRDQLNGLVLDAARTEQNPAVLLTLLPVLAIQERSDGEPILAAYLDNGSLTSEVRATAAEILVESGWWSPEQLQQWLDDPARAAEERATIMDDLGDAFRTWTEAARLRSLATR